MKDRSGKKNKSEIFNERMKQRTEKANERKRLFEEAGKPDTNVKKDDSAPQHPSAPSTAKPATPEPPAAPPKQAVKEKPNRPGKADRERRGPTRHGGSRF